MAESETEDGDIYADDKRSRHPSLLYLENLTATHRTHRPKMTVAPSARLDFKVLGMNSGTSMVNTLPPRTQALANPCFPGWDRLCVLSFLAGDPGITDEL